MIDLPTGRSPHDLLQEQQVGRPNGVWRVLVVCQLLNRTHGRQVRPLADERYGAPLFVRWPTPHAMSLARLPELQLLLRPLGFAEQRSRSLKAMSAQYNAMLFADPEFWRGSEDGEWCKGLQGCGQYAKESLDLVVYGRLSAPTTDHWLTKYQQWRLSQAAGTAELDDMEAS